ncbi:MAG: DUF4197 domain-containing protein [Sulfurospirillaceae bacterium]|nr:DUF4197 domain-containing protein [Sulfurospirillaceae bacterium]MDD2827039.1 DUF4197 domain-containing protein [Sulfurospirillaceae bacterium]
MLKKTIFLSLPLLLFAGWQNALQSVVETTSPNTQKTSTSTTSSALSQDYTSKGLKEALGLGVNQAISLLSKDGGFLNNSAVKIPLPSSLQSVASLAEKAGGKAYVDDLVKTMNTAASKAVPKTANILGKTVSNMSMEDAKSIANGTGTAATDYFKSKSSAQLLEAIMPIVKESAKENKVLSSYQTLTSLYSSNKGSIPGSNLLGQASGVAKSFGMGDALPNENEDIETYIGRKTLDGLFYMIGEKEKALRANPLSSGSKVIQDIFGK